MVDGKVLMLDRKFVSIDEERIAAEARARAPKIWERYNQQAIKAMKTSN
jgi:hypothetical protein